MSAIKSNEKVHGKYSFRTTITQEIYDEFRDTCKRMGVPMNIVLESFMKDFNSGLYEVCVRKTSK